MYNREESIKMLQDNYGWKPYGLKHGENYFTAWFQNHYLFDKFGIDKRLAHYSSLINSGQMTRNEAMDLLEKNEEYPSLGELDQKIFKYPKGRHEDYKQDKWYGRIAKFVKLWRF